MQHMDVVSLVVSATSGIRLDSHKLYLDPFCMAGDDLRTLIEVKWRNYLFKCNEHE